MIAYKTATRSQTRIVLKDVCCKGYTWNTAQYRCVMDQGFVAIVPPSTSVPGSNHSEATTPDVDDDDFGNATGRNITGDRLPGRGKGATVTPTTTTELFTKPGQQTTTDWSTDKMFAGFQSRMRAPLGAKILFGSLPVLGIILVCAIIAGFVRHRRRKMHLRRKTKRIQHFRPSFAPDDEYAIVDKGAAEQQVVVQESSLIYENADVGPVVVKGGLSECPKQASPEKPHLSNDKDEDDCIESKLDGCYTEVDDSCLVGGAGCYTEVDESCLVGGAGPLNDQNRYPTEGKRESLMSNLMNKLRPKRLNSLRHTYMEGPCPQQFCDSQQSGKTTEIDDCYTEVDEIANGQTGNQDEYAVVDDTLPDITYDHIDREAHTDRSNQMDNVDGVKSVVGRYGVLVQSSSVETPEEYDALQRSLSQDGKASSGYGSLLAQSSQGETEGSTEELTQSGHCDSYDTVNRYPANTGEPKSKGRRLKLVHTKGSATYNRIESSKESENADNEAPKGLGDGCREPLYTNQDVLNNGTNGDSACSTYTDMSGCLGCNAVAFSERQDKANDNLCYTEMAPQPRDRTPDDALMAGHITYECPVDYAAIPENCNKDSADETEWYINPVRGVNGGAPSNTIEGNNEARSDKNLRNNSDQVYENV
ncbi:uncharacterized protein [Diadema antillarum]|uniref:uncharacterized protein n=1 Tax=Diadema antillarum TaxID=105358 RepID=UPI003A88EDE5